jgi:anti-anti-sigma factor
MHKFCCTVDFDGQCAVALLTGELDMSNVQSLVDRLRPVVMTGRHLVVDFADVRFFGSAGLDALAELQERAAAAGGSVRLAEPSAPVRRLLNIAGMTDRFTIVWRAADAGRALRNTAAGDEPQSWDLNSRRC